MVHDHFNHLDIALRDPGHSALIQPDMGNGFNNQHTLIPFASLSRHQHTRNARERKKIQARFLTTDGRMARMGIPSFLIRVINEIRG
jgi:hypothetical protein